MEEFGDIIKTEPIVQDIEDEKFDNKFILFLITSRNKDEISKSLRAVSELKSVDIEAINQDSMTIRETNSVKYQSDSKLPKLSSTKHITSKGINGLKKD